MSLLERLTCYTHVLKRDGIGEFEIVRRRLSGAIVHLVYFPDDGSGVYYPLCELDPDVQAETINKVGDCASAAQARFWVESVAGLPRLVQQ